MPKCHEIDTVQSIVEDNSLISNYSGVSVVIPAFNEERNIALVITNIKAVLDRLKKNYEIIVVDDHSTDLTGEIALELGAHVIINDSNKGYGETLKIGVNNCKYDIIVTVDADGQIDPANIPSLIEPIIQNSADVVIGSRFSEEMRPGAMEIGDKIGNRIISLIIKGTRKGKVSIKDSQSGFRAYKKEVVVKQFSQLRQKGIGVSTEILLNVSEAYRVVEVPIIYRPREHIGYSSFSFLRDGFNVLKITLKHLLRRQ